MRVTTCLGWQPVCPVVPGRSVAVLIKSPRCLKSVVSRRAIEGVVFVLTLFLQQSSKCLLLEKSACLSTVPNKQLLRGSLFKYRMLANNYLGHMF